MGLINSTTAANFEDEGDDTSASAVFANAPQADYTPPAALPAAQPAAQPAQPAYTAVTVAPSNAVSVPAPAYAIIEGMKDALVVGFNTFPQITASNGNFVERESRLNLGDTIVFELESYQDSWVVDPGDEKAPKELVRYSDDSVICSDGTPVQEHLHFLKAGGYVNATLKQRSVIVCEVISCSKSSKYNGEMMQFDLSPMSRVQWQRYLANSVNSLRKGRKTEAQLKLITATTELSVGGGGKQYTKATFAVTAA